MGGRTSTPVIEIGPPRRNSYDPLMTMTRNNLTSPSTQSLPNDISRANLGVVGKGMNGSTRIPGPTTGRSRGGPTRATPTDHEDFNNFNYESDFESDDEDVNNITLATTTLTKIKLLKKKKENMKEIERRRVDRDSKKVEEERIRKYRQLELQHSRDSLQPSRVSSGASDLEVAPNHAYLKRTPRPSPRVSPRPSPRNQNRIITPSRQNNEPRKPTFSRSRGGGGGGGVRRPRTPPSRQPRSPPRSRARSPVQTPQTQQRVPKSRSHHSSLNRSTGGPPPPARNDNRRHRSLDRVSPRTNGAQSRETFRTPQPPRRSIGGGGLSSSRSSHGSSAMLNSSLNKSRSFRSNPLDRSSDDLNMSMSSAGIRTAKPQTSTFSGHLEPFPKPQEGLRNALVQMSHSDWENQVKGIEDIVRVIKNHPEAMQGSLHEVNMALLNQAKNLRSQVSRAAIQAFTWAFDNLGRSMEYDAEKIISVLLHRTGDTNKFLQLDCHHALDAMVENIAANKAIPALVNEGVGHINTKVRTTCARLLAYLVERLGPDKVLSGSKDITDRILPAGVKLAQEGSLETRKYAKQIFQSLVSHPQFDSVLKKHVSSTDVKNTQKFFDSLENRKGVMDSARSKVGAGSRFNRTM